MSVFLKVTPEELIAASEELLAEALALERCLGEAEESVNAASSYWNGAASSVHQSLFGAFTDEMRPLIGRWKEYPITLRNIAGIYDQASWQAADASQGLAADIIV